eukprot:SAG22_NODE_214_length_15003_cov_18.466519_22_plen_101_part_00
MVPPWSCQGRQGMRAGIGWHTQPQRGFVAPQHAFYRSTIGEEVASYLLPVFAWLTVRATYCDLAGGAGAPCGIRPGSSCSKGSGEGLGCLAAGGGMRGPR